MAAHTVAPHPGHVDSIPQIQAMTSALPLPVRHILQAATPVLRISGLHGPRWKRNVKTGARIGPWLSARYDVLDARAWSQPGACLYLVTGGDQGLRYVGISRNGLKHRWRTSPAIDATSGAPLSERQLFHSQCWKHIEAEFERDPQASFQVLCIAADALGATLGQLTDPIAALAVLKDDGETVVGAVERWICNRASASLARWNVAMTGRA